MEEVSNRGARRKGAPDHFRHFASLRSFSFRSVNSLHDSNWDSWKEARSGSSPGISWYPIAALHVPVQINILSGFGVTLKSLLYGTKVPPQVGQVSDMILSVVRLCAPYPFLRVLATGVH
ncbi:hypothetical protein EBR66_08670 [bacterium]|nr:hypothetical protein [bacterium]